MVTACTKNANNGKLANEYAEIILMGIDNHSEGSPQSLDQWRIGHPVTCMTEKGNAEIFPCNCAEIM
jgi:hypothetical protein